nr:MAG TPA: hypothetical protein [Caudoviricetes sp.]
MKGHKKSPVQRSRPNRATGQISPPTAFLTWSQLNERA